MFSVGSSLRQLRERKGVSLDEIARTTRVARRHLEALERDDHAALPERVFAKGFVRAYCQALREPAEELLARYEAEARGGAGRAPGRGYPVAVPRGADDRRGRGAVLASFVLLVVLGLALFAVTVVLQPERRSDVAERPPDAPPEPVAIATATTPEAPSALPASEPAPPAETLPARPATPDRRPTPPYRLVARATEATWVRVRTGGARAVEETIPAGETREWVSSEPFVLTIGNAGGIILELNGRELPPLGARGAVVSRLVLPSEDR